jgi:nicotinamidase/pyrazinamidase
MRTEFDRQRAALVVVDVQPDFMPGGALPVHQGDQIIPAIATLLRGEWFALVAATQDWHPPGHISFASRHPGRKPMDRIEVSGHEQVLWPDHCVQGSAGAELHPGIPWEHADVIIRKGADPKVDSYSAFRSNWNELGNRPPTGLAGYLREHGAERVFICGLARDVCVKWSAEDARQEGFRVTVLWDLTRPVDPLSDEVVWRELSERDVEIVNYRSLRARMSADHWRATGAFMTQRLLKPFSSILRSADKG